MCRALNRRPEGAAIRRAFLAFISERLNSRRNTRSNTRTNTHPNSRLVTPFLTRTPFLKTPLRPCCHKAWHAFVFVPADEQ